MMVMPCKVQGPQHLGVANWCVLPCQNWRTGGPPIDHLHVRIGMLIDFVTSRLDARMPEKIVWESTEDSPSGAFKLPPVAHALCCSIHMSVK